MTKITKNTFGPELTRALQMLNWDFTKRTDHGSDIGGLGTSDFFIPPADQSEGGVKLSVGDYVNPNGSVFGRNSIRVSEWDEDSATHLSPSLAMEDCLRDAFLEVAEVLPGLKQRFKDVGVYASEFEYPMALMDFYATLSGLPESNWEEELQAWFKRVMPDEEYSELDESELSGLRGEFIDGAQYEIPDMLRKFRFKMEIAALRWQLRCSGGNEERIGAALEEYVNYFVCEYAEFIGADFDQISVECGKLIDIALDEQVDTSVRHAVLEIIDGMSDRASGHKRVKPGLRLVKDPVRAVFEKTMDESMDARMWRIWDTNMSWPKIEAAVKYFDMDPVLEGLLLDCLPPDSLPEEETEDFLTEINDLVDQALLMTKDQEDMTRLNILAGWMLSTVHHHIEDLIAPRALKIAQEVRQSVIELSSGNSDTDKLGGEVARLANGYRRLSLWFEDAEEKSVLMQMGTSDNLLQQIFAENALVST